MKKEDIDWEPLMAAALEARKSAHAPYSQFSVGAALLDSSGGIHKGCNVENLSFGLTICAERTAAVSAVAQGIKEFQAIAIVADTKTPVTPCGACRQFLIEFGDIAVRSFTPGGENFDALLSELLPRASEGILEGE